MPVADTLCAVLLQAPTPDPADALKIAILGAINAFIVLVFNKLWDWVTAERKRQAEVEDRKAAIEEAERKRKAEIEDLERNRRWQREDAEWKAQMDARQAVTEQKQDALMEQVGQVGQDVQANTVVSTVAMAASQVGAVAAAKAAAHLTGEPEHKIAELADVRKQLGEIFNQPGHEDGIAQAPPGPAGTRTGPR